MTTDQPRTYREESLLTCDLQPSNTNDDASSQGQDESHEAWESKKPSDQILQHELSEAHNALERSMSWLVLSGLGAGLNVGFGVMLMAIARTMGQGVWSEPALTLLTANLYSLGFIIVVLGRSELFTEQTTLAMLPVLARQASIFTLARLWVVVLAMNLIGAAAFAAVLAWLGPQLGVIEPKAFASIAHDLVNSPWPIILAGGIVAGWLMGVLSWLVAAARETISQIVIVWLIATTIGLGKLHHSIVGSIEVLTSVFAGQGTDAWDFARFLLWASLGNLIGGILFATIVIYGHVRSKKLRSG